VADIKINEKLVVSQTGTAEPVLASNVDLSSATGIPAAGITGVLPVGVTGGSGLDAVSAGITHASTWQMNTAFNMTGGTQFDSFTKAITQSQASLGTDMTHSSGIFTFPTTGIWFMEWHITFNVGTNTNRYVEASIQTTTNNSTWVETARKMTNIASTSGSNDYGGCDTSLIWDVTSTTTHKIRFHSYVYAGSNIDVYGGTTTNFTYATFIRLGDT
jgi:hypothetical protein